ncbi:VPLPA-CTERM sorting domain-containing protein [Dinoroseobacter sp. S76]|uniref:VPLPA-CTERM sorting domain-containing protein n=1 Tax=Dinoroseobacter sp. S76 TaxID=3415124 RepID=UPI003C7C2798
MNTTPLLAICAAILLPNLVQAATVTTLVEARSVTGDTIQGEVVNEMSSQAPQSLSASTPNATATANTDVENWEFQLRSDVERPSGDPASEEFARARADITQTFEVVGTGTVFFEMQIGAGLSILSDRGDATDLAHVIAGFEASTATSEIYERVSNRDPDDFLFEELDAAIGGTLTGEIDVTDGQMLTISAFGLADAGDFPLDELTRLPQSAFFDVTAISNGTLSFVGKGVELLPTDLDVAPVPLPASLPLLLGGLGAMVAYRRRATRG